MTVSAQKKIEKVSRLPEPQSRISMLAKKLSCEGIFDLYKTGKCGEKTDGTLFDPTHEQIIGLREWNRVKDKRGLLQQLTKLREQTEELRISLLKVREYCVYPRAIGVAVGKSIVYVENGKDYAFEIPDVRHPSKDMSLRKAKGVAFDVGDLEYDKESRLTRVRTSFNENAAWYTAIDDVGPTRLGLKYVGRTRTFSGMHLGTRESHRLETLSSGCTGKFGWHGSISISGLHGWTEYSASGYRHTEETILVTQKPGRTGMAAPLQEATIIDLSQIRNK